MIELREYQTEALDACEQAEREGVRRPLIVHPTGTGKGVVMGGAAKRRAHLGRTLVLVHREELASQFIEKLGWQAPELETGIVKAEANELDAPVVVASIDTVTRDNRLAELLASDKRSPFETLLCDEAHLAPAPKWVKVLRAMGSFSPYGPLTIGFTATPERDKKALGVWEKVVSFMSIREGIFRGFLCPILPAEVVETSMDLRKVRKTGGDFSEGDLGRELEDSGAVEQIADGVLKHAKDRKGLVFLPTVKTAHLLAEALRKRGITAEALDGGTEKTVRKAILARLKSGETQIVTNCAVLTTGFDEPSISFIGVARPTTSHTLYVQMIGRGTRVSPGKDDLLVADFVGATTRHDLITRVDLDDELDDPKKRKETEGNSQPCPTCETPECEYPEHRCALCHRYLPVGRVRDGETRHENCRAGGKAKVDLFGASRLRWLPIGPGWCLGSESEVLVMVPAGMDAWKLAVYRDNRVQVLHDCIPVDWAMGIGEDRVKAFESLARRDKSWLRRPVSGPQKSRLLREGLPESKLHLVKTRGEAADLVTRIQARRAVKKLTT